MKPNLLRQNRIQRASFAILCVVTLFSSLKSVNAQSVCLPAPRLLTTMPMGGQTGSTIEVTITGQNLDAAEELLFSHPGITSKKQVDANGQPIPLKYEVTIATDCPTGIHEAYVMTRLGISSSRVFTVSKRPEVVRTKPNTTLETAMLLEVNSLCNGVMTKQSIDYYTFNAEKNQRIVVDCGAEGIDSKLKPVLIVADENGGDLLVERRGGAIDFTAPETATYVIKVHDLTYNGGAEYFYRLSLQELSPDEQVERLPSIQLVNSFSWPPSQYTEETLETETEPNNQSKEAQQISLPCLISGNFYPAADVDTFEFEAKKGEVWWVEVASERMGRQTDPFVLVQHVGKEGEQEKLTDIAELNDIPSPVKVSSNGYSYDGPPYNAGSTDVLGKVEIKEDGTHRLQLRDLFGGTRNDPSNDYRLIIRKANPDFALVGWALHMNLRNGDRNALSKPLALRGGTTMPIEVVVVRRDGFDGEIDIEMTGLPTGVSATGLKIPAGQSRGILLVTAEVQAPRGLSQASVLGKALINDQNVVRPCSMASMQWPVVNAAQEIPSPRLLTQVPVSVCEIEGAPVSIAAAEDKVWEVIEGETLTIPLAHTHRCEFSGAIISLKTYGAGFEKVPGFDAPLNKATSEAVLDLKALKTPPGEYTIAFYGSAVAKYQDCLEAVAEAEKALADAKAEVEKLSKESLELAEVAKTVTGDDKPIAEKNVQESNAKLKTAQAEVVAAEKKLKAATVRAKPKDIVDIVVSKPIRIRVKPAEKS